VRGNELLEWLATLPAAARDAALDQYLGIADATPASDPPGTDLIGYHASSVAAIVRAFIEVPLQPQDTFVDLGAGLGKVVLLAHLLTGARARGIELQPELVARSRHAARKLGIDIELEQGDAREAELETGTVFYLYAPFTGPALGAALVRLERVAQRHAIVICALGVDLPRAWLVPRGSDSFWLTVYDSVVSGATPRSAGHSALKRSLADIVILER
jgi:SAM-dependent methyltransferase